MEGIAMPILSCHWTTDKNISENNPNSVRTMHRRQQRKSDRWKMSTSRSEVPQIWTLIIYRQPSCPCQRAVSCWTDLSSFYLCYEWDGLAPTGQCTHSLPSTLIHFIHLSLIQFIICPPYSSCFLCKLLWNPLPPARLYCVWHTTVISAAALFCSWNERCMNIVD